MEIAFVGKLADAEVDLCKARTRKATQGECKGFVEGGILLWPRQSFDGGDLFGLERDHAQVQSLGEKGSDPLEHGPTARDIEGLELLTCAALECRNRAPQFGQDGGKGTLDGLVFGRVEGAGWCGQIDVRPKHFMGFVGVEIAGCDEGLAELAGSALNRADEFGAYRFFGILGIAAKEGEGGVSETEVKDAPRFFVGAGFAVGEEMGIRESIEHQDAGIDTGLLDAAEIRSDFVEGCVPDKQARAFFGGLDKLIIEDQIFDLKRGHLIELETKDLLDLCGVGEREFDHRAGSDRTGERSDDLIDRADGLECLCNGLFARLLYGFDLCIGAIIEGDRLKVVGFNVVLAARVLENHSFDRRLADVESEDSLGHRGVPFLRGSQRERVRFFGVKGLLELPEVDFSCAAWLHKDHCVDAALNTPDLSDGFDTKEIGVGGEGDTRIAGHCKARKLLWVDLLLEVAGSESLGEVGWEDVGIFAPVEKSVVVFKAEVVAPCFHRLNELQKGRLQEDTAIKRGFGDAVSHHKAAQDVDIGLLDIDTQWPVHGEEMAEGLKEDVVDTVDQAEFFDGVEVRVFRVVSFFIVAILAVFGVAFFARDAVVWVDPVLDGGDLFLACDARAVSTGIFEEWVVTWGGKDGFQLLA